MIKILIKLIFKNLDGLVIIFFNKSFCQVSKYEKKETGRIMLSIPHELLDNQK